MITTHRVRYCLYSYEQWVGKQNAENVGNACGGWSVDYCHARCLLLLLCMLLRNVPSSRNIKTFWIHFYVQTVFIYRIGTELYERRHCCCTGNNFVRTLEVTTAVK